MERHPHDLPDSARGLEEGDSEAETGGPASPSVDRTSQVEPASPDSDFAGTGGGRPSGTGQPFETADPAMTDQPAEGGEAEADE